MYIKNSGLRANLNRFCLNLSTLLSENLVLKIRYFSYTNRCVSCEKKPTAHFSTFGFSQCSEPNIQKPKELKFRPRTWRKSQE